MPLTIKTDGKWRNLMYRIQVPAKVLASRFEHLHPDHDYDGFIKYRGSWYHMSDFSTVGSHTPLAAWDGYLNDSFFSGIVVRVSADAEQVKLGRFYS